MENEHQSKKSSKSNKINIVLDLRAVILFLILVIIGLLFIWKPWDDNATRNHDRTITVTGETKIKAEPDEFVFNPIYEFTNPDKDTALAELSKRSETLVNDLKGLGVPDNKIQSNANGYSNLNLNRPERLNTYTLHLNVKTESREQADKLQAYLKTTSPSGSVSPQATFSENKRKELESKARDEATNDARAKAEQSAKNLGFKVGEVKSINDGSSQGGVMPFTRGSNQTFSVAEDTASPGLSIQPGENDLSYAVEVTYFLR